MSATIQERAATLLAELEAVARFREADTAENIITAVLAALSAEKDAEIANRDRHIATLQRHIALLIPTPEKARGEDTVKTHPEDVREAVEQRDEYKRKLRETEAEKERLVAELTQARKERDENAGVSERWRKHHDDLVESYNNVRTELSTTLASLRKAEEERNTWMCSAKLYHSELRDLASGKKVETQLASPVEKIIRELTSERDTAQAACAEAQEALSYGWNQHKLVLEDTRAQFRGDCWDFWNYLIAKIDRALLPAAGQSLLTELAAKDDAIAQVRIEATGPRNASHEYDPTPTAEERLAHIGQILAALTPSNRSETTK